MFQVSRIENTTKQSNFIRFYGKKNNNTAMPSIFIVYCCCSCMRLISGNDKCFVIEKINYTIVCAASVQMLKKKKCNFPPSNFGLLRIKKTQRETHTNSSSRKKGEQKRTLKLNTKKGKQLCIETVKFKSLKAVVFACLCINV